MRQKRLGEFRQRPAYALVRAWDQSPELGHEHFELFDIRERVCPLGLSVIAHHYPCPDTLPAWFEHPNTASALTGLIFRDAQPGAYAQRASAVLDISGFGYWPALSIDLWGRSRHRRLRARGFVGDAEAMGRG